MFSFFTILNWLFPTSLEQVTPKQIKNKTMEVAVWDTYVKKKDGNTMHFDIIAPTSIKDVTIIYQYGKLYLKEKKQEGQLISSKECRFCHIEKATEAMQTSINKIGYYIIEMEGCQ